MFCNATSQFILSNGLQVETTGTSSNKSEAQPHSRWQSFLEEVNNMMVANDVILTIMILYFVLADDAV